MVAKKTLAPNAGGVGVKMKKLLTTICCLVAVSCVHFRLGSAFIDDYSEKQNKYVELRQCKTPLGIVPDDSLSAEDILVLLAAVEFWNQQIGREMFHILDGYETDMHIASIVGYKEGAYFCDDNVAKTHLKYDIETGCIGSANINITCGLNNYPEWTQYFVMRHELGHVLGLDDSDSSWSIMYRSVDRLGEINEIRDSEKAALERMYGGN